MFHFHRAARSAVRILSLALVLSTLLYTSTHRLLIRSTGNLHWSSVLDYGHLPTPSAAIAPVEVEKSAKAKLLRETTEFWNELEEAPWEAAPRINAVAPSQQHIEQNFDEKWPDLVHEELITSSPRDKKQLRESHAEMVKAIPALARRLPYKKRTRGVVMTAGEKYINVLMVSLRMLRRVGSELPVEVYFDKRTVATTGVCLAQMAELNAECRFFSEVWQEVHMTELKSFQLKVFALLFSTFEDVLFLDADALAVKNPDQLLSAEPFSNTGLVTWPDFWSSSTSPSFWDVAGVDEGVGKKEDSARASTESGVLLLSKWKHAGTLLLATYYNYYGPGYFYPLLSQSAQGEGQVLRITSPSSSCWLTSAQRQSHLPPCRDCDEHNVLLCKSCCKSNRQPLWRQMGKCRHEAGRSTGRLPEKRSSGS
jgi:hypothetical protein